MNDFAPDWSRPTNINMNWNSGSGSVEYNNGDRGLLVAFRWHSVPNAVKSREMGRPIFERKPYVRIQHIGDQTTVIDRPIISEGPNDDRRRFARHWEAFLKNQVPQPEGTPISVLFPHQPDIVSNLQAFGIQTVEMMAIVNAHGIDSIGMGAQEWQNKARKYLEDAKRGVDHHAMEAMKSQFERELRVRDNQIHELISQINKLTDALANQSVHVQGVVGQQVVSGVPAPPPANPFPYSAPAPSQQSMDDILRPVDDFVVSGPADLESVVAPADFFDNQAEQIAANHPTELAAQRRQRRRSEPV